MTGFLRAPHRRLLDNPTTQHTTRPPQQQPPPTTTTTKSRPPHSSSPTQINQDGKVWIFSSFAPRPPAPFIFIFPFLEFTDLSCRGKPRGLNAARKLRTHRRDKYDSPPPSSIAPRTSRKCANRSLQPMGRRILQEAASRNRLQIVALRRVFARQGHRAGEGWRRGQAAQLGHPQVCAGAAHQERQEGYCFRYVVSWMRGGGRGPVTTWLTKQMNDSPQ